MRSIYLFGELSYLEARDTGGLFMKFIYFAGRIAIEQPWDQQAAMGSHWVI